MENPSRKCEICAEASPNQTKLPRHYILDNVVNEAYETSHENEGVEKIGKSLVANVMSIKFSRSAIVLVLWSIGEITFFLSLPRIQV